MKRLLGLIVAALAGINFAFAAVNLNTASQSELESVKGIGPTKAKAIIDHRNKNGAFKTVDDLKEIKGFGDKSLAKLRGELTVAPASSAPKAQETGKK